MPTKVRCLGRAALVAWVLLGTDVWAAQPDLRLVTAAKVQDVAAVHALLDEGVDVNAARADGVTALLWAAHWDDVETAELLLRAGADADTAEDQGVTPLLGACENGSASMVGLVPVGRRECRDPAGQRRHAADDGGADRLARHRADARRARR